MLFFLIKTKMKKLVYEIVSVTKMERTLKKNAFNDKN